MTNNRLSGVQTADCHRQPQREEDVEAVDAVVGEGLHPALAGTPLNRGVAGVSTNRQIDLRYQRGSAARDRRRLGRWGDPVVATSFKIVDAAEHCQRPHGKSSCSVFARSRISMVERSREVRCLNEEATPLPYWMRATHPNQAGTLIPVLLSGLAVSAAISGILSTILELAWL